MFTTNQTFKHPLQFGDHTTIWRAVELTLHTPWFLVSVQDGEEMAKRTFLMSCLRDVLLLAEGAPIGKAISLYLAQPPGRSATNDWMFVPMRRVDRQLQKNDGSAAELVVTGMDGVQYSDFPFERIEGDIGPLVPLAEFT